MEHLGKGFLDTLIITMPIVMTAAGIGLVIGILQAVTQVQEQTIQTAPKILGVFLVIMIMGGFFSNILNEYLIESIELAFNVIPKQDDYLLPAIGYPGTLKESKKYTGGKRADFNSLMNTPGKVPYSDKKYKQSVTRSSPSSNAQPNLLEIMKISKGK